MHLVIIIPCLNESKSIGAVIDSIPSTFDKIDKKTIVIIDDGSTDGTAEIAREKGVTVLKHEKNKGVGASFRTGIQHALKIEADLVVNMDGDGQFNPNDIKLLIDPILEREADFVTASRFIHPEFYPEMSKIKFHGNKMMSRIISRLTGNKFYDVSCGFRGYSKEALLNLNLFGQFTYTQESFIDMAFKSISIKEIPVKIRGRREHGKSRVASNLFAYAYRTLKIIINTYRDYRPFKLFSLIAGLNLLLALGFGIFLGLYYCQYQVFTPYKWTGFAGGFFAIVGLVFYVIGFILEMFTRMRVNQEKILYYLKNNHNAK